MIIYMDRNSLKINSLKINSVFDHFLEAHGYCSWILRNMDVLQMEDIWKSETLTFIK